MTSGAVYAALKAKLDTGETIIIDGGTGTELERRGAVMTDGAWCGASGMSEPEMLQEIHETYIGLGCEVIIANTYASSRHVCEQGGFGDRFEEANRSSVAAALAARDAAGSVVVAGSISTTHQQAGQVPLEVARRNHADQAMILADSGADLLVAEMMRDIDHTHAVIDAMQATGLPMWVGFTVFERAGELLMWDSKLPFREGFAQIDLDGTDVVTLMHCEVSDTDAGLDVLDDLWDGPTGVYAQTGEFISPNWQFIDTISPADYTAAAAHWASRGVQVLGGCCGIGPEHISHMQAHL